MIDSVPRGEHVPTADRRVVMYGVSWEAFEAILKARGDAKPRVAYLEGTLELMSPSRDHENIKTYFASVIEEYLDSLDIEYDGVGAWLLKHAPGVAGLEPDECYILHDAKKPRPDLAIEVVWTSGGINKLEIYRRLQIGEVWFWIDDRIDVYVLTDDRWEKRTTSACLPEFDFALALEMLELPTLSAIRKAIRARLAK